MAYFETTLGGVSSIVDASPSPASPGLPAAEPSRVRTAVLRGLALALALEGAFVAGPVLSRLATWRGRPPGELGIAAWLALLAALVLLQPAARRRAQASGRARLARILALGPFVRALLVLALVAGTIDAARGLASFGQVRVWRLCDRGGLAFATWTVAVVTSLVELAFARRRPGRARDVLGTLAVALAAAASLPATKLEGDLASSALNALRWGQWRTIAASWGTVTTGWTSMLRHPEGCLVLTLAAALPFAALALARLQRRSLAVQTAFTLGVCGALSLPILAIARGGLEGLDDLGSALVRGALLLPLAAWVADRVERAIERALSRDEVAREPALPARRARALAVAFVLVGAASGLEHVAGKALALPKPDPEAPAPRPASLDPELVRAFEAWEAGRLAPEEVAALVSRTVSVSHHVRPRLRPEDSLAFGRDASFTTPPGFTLDIRTLTFVDGAPPPTGKRSSSQRNADWPRNGTANVYAVHGWNAQRNVRPGRHEVRWHSELRIVAGEEDDGRELWRGSLDESATFEVDPAAPPPVRLVRGPAPTLETRAYFDGAHVVEARLGPSELVLCGRFAVEDDAGQGFHTMPFSHLLGPEVPRTWLRAGVDRWDASARHQVTLQFVPDLDEALAASTHVEEIYGETLERTFAVSSW